MRGPGQWAAVGPVWTALSAVQPPTRHLQTPEWARAVTEGYHDEAARWLLVEDDGGPLAAVPYRLDVRRLGPLRVRRLANDRPTDALIHPRLDPAALRRTLLAASAEAGEPIDVVSLNGLRSGMGFLRLATASGYGIETEVRHGGYSTIDTTIGADDWRAAAGKNLRAGLRKAGNRIRRRGTVTVTEATTPDDVARAFDEYVAIEASGWKAEAGALVNRPRDRALLHRFFVDGAAGGRVLVRILRLDGRPVAGQLAAVTARSLELFKVAYDEAYAELSPSNLLMADLVEACCGRPDVDRIDLLTDQPWHRRWHAASHPTYKARDLDLRRPGGLTSRVAVALEGAGVRLPVT